MYFWGTSAGETKKRWLSTVPLHSASSFCFCELSRQTSNFCWQKIIYHWRSFLCGNFNYKRNLPLFPLNFRGRCILGWHLLGKLKSSVLSTVSLQSAWCFSVCEISRQTSNFCWQKRNYHWRSYLCGNFSNKRNLPLFSLNFRGGTYFRGHLMGKQKALYCVLSPYTAHHAFAFVKFPGKRQTFTYKKIFHWRSFLCGNFNCKRNLPLFPLNFRGRCILGGHLLMKQKSAGWVLSPSTAHQAFVFVNFLGKLQTFVDKK